QGGGVHGAEGGEGIEGKLDAGGGELFGGEERGFAEFGDIREDRDFDGVNELAVLGEGGEGFGEKHVGTGIAIGDGARDARLHAFAGDGVGACHEDEGRICFAGDGEFDAADHFGGADELFAG